MNPRTILGPLRRGTGDPCFRVDGSALWIAGLAPEPVTVRVDADGASQTWGAEVDVAAWLGAGDDPAGFVPRHRVVQDQWRVHGATWRVPRTLLTWQIAVSAVLEQRVTGIEAWKAWRGLVREHGHRAPGPRDDLWVPPDPAELLNVPSWDWRRYGVDRQRIATLREVARAPHLLDRAAQLPPAQARESLRVIPGVGVWTAAEISARAFGDADAVSFGDYHLARNVTWALTGTDGGTDEDMARLLAPYAGHRHRAVRMIELAGVAPPRKGPRMRMPGPR